MKNVGNREARRCFSDLYEAARLSSAKRAFQRAMLAARMRQAARGHGRTVLADVARAAIARAEWLAPDRVILETDGCDLVARFTKALAFGLPAIARVPAEPSNYRQSA